MGQQALGAFEDREFTPFVHHEHEDLDGERLEVTVRQAFVEAVSGHDVLIHLAANPSARWEEVHEPNVQGTPTQQAIGYEPRDNATEALADRT